MSDEDADRLLVAALGARIRLERSKHRLSLDDLSSRSGVSRSMLSAIERGAKAPTVVLLDKIANALSVSVSRLLDEERPDKVVFLRKDQQKCLAGDRWHRRIVSPVLQGVDFELGRSYFEPGTDAGEFAPHEPGWTEYFAVETGTVEITLDRRHVYILEAGDALYFESDILHAYRNIGCTEAVGYVVMSGGGARTNRFAH